MPNILCFCVYVCAGTGYVKNGQNQAKTDKIEHEIGKSTKLWSQSLILLGA